MFLLNTEYFMSRNVLNNLVFFLSLDQPIRMDKIGKVHGAGKELLPLELNAFGLKVLFPMSSVVTLVVSNVKKSINVM